MQVKNVVIVNDFGIINGGASQVAISTAVSLAHHGYNVYYFYATNPVEEILLNNPRIKVISTNQIDILNNPKRLSAFIQGIWNRKSNTLLNRLLSTLSPADTIVHIHGWTKALSPSVISVTRAKSFPDLITLHDYFFACPNGGFYNYQKDEICRLKALSINCLASHCDSRNYWHKLWRVVRSFLQNYLVKLPRGKNHLIAVSKKSLEILSPYINPASVVFHLPNPIHTKLESRVKVENNEKFFAVGRLSPEKGFDLVGQAMRELGIKMVFIGDGGERSELEMVNPEAEFPGHLSREILFEKMKEAKALIFSSKCLETQGLVVNEAASMGIPAIVSDVTVASELITDNVSGLLFKSNDNEDLKEKILKLKDKAFLRNLSENVYEQFWKHPPLIEDYTKQLEAIYLAVLSDHANKSGQK